MTDGTGETITLWSVWRERRHELRSFGQVCAMAHAGRLPGTVNIAGERTPRVRVEALPAAIAAMKQEAN